MNRRELLKLLALGVIDHTLDIDKLLWMPGEKIIFLPPTKILTESDIIRIELERVLPKLKSLFDRDDFFYKYIFKLKSGLTMSELQIPLSYAK